MIRLFAYYIYLFLTPRSGIDGTGILPNHHQGVDQVDGEHLTGLKRKAGFQIDTTGFVAEGKM